MNSEIIKTPIGSLQIKTQNNTVVAVNFTDNIDSEDDSISCDQEIIDNYFNGTLTTIDLKYLLIGTPFQNKVWEEILKIPYGETRTYSDIATAIGNPKGYRAVANTCGENKLALIVPCHRVVGKNNYIGGYKWGVDKKAWLLKFEALNKQKMSVDMLQAIT